MDASNRTEQRLCKTHGPYEAKVAEILGRVLASHCPACLATSKALEDERARRSAQEAERRTIETLFQRAGIPPRFQSRSFENYTADTDGQEKALNVAKAYAERWPEMLGNGTCLIFSGKAGTGKTHLACAIANAVMAQGSSALFTTVAEAMRSIKRAYDKDAGVSEADAINALVQPRLLILDEAGADFGTEHSKTLLFDVINKRYECVQPTIILTNLDAPALREYLGDRIADRLREGGGRMVGFAWESHRA